MSEYTLDELGFKAPGTPTQTPSSDSSLDNPPEVRRKFIACPRRMSKKTADRHTLCISCRGFDCDVDSRCEECIEWPEEEVRLYAKYRKSLKSKDSSKSKSLQLLLLLLPTPCPLRNPMRVRICNPKLIPLMLLFHPY